MGVSSYRSENQKETQKIQVNISLQQIGSTVVSQNSSSGNVAQPQENLWRESETKMSYAELAFDVSEAVCLSLCTHCVSLSKHCLPPPSLLLYGRTRQSWLGSRVQVKEQMTAQFRIPGEWIWSIQLFISSSSSYGCGHPPTPTPHPLCEEREKGEMGGRKGGRKGGVALREWGLLGWGTLVKHPSSTLWGETTLDSV